jgi:hypothetical protein
MNKGTNLENISADEKLEKYIIFRGNSSDYEDELLWRNRKKRKIEVNKK